MSTHDEAAWRTFAAALRDKVDQANDSDAERERIERDSASYLREEQLPVPSGAESLIVRFQREAPHYHFRFIIVDERGEEEGRVYEDDDGNWYYFPTMIA